MWGEDAKIVDSISIDDDDGNLGDDEGSSPDLLRPKKRRCYRAKYQHCGCRKDAKMGDKSQSDSSEEDIQVVKYPYTRWLPKAFARALNLNKDHDGTRMCEGQGPNSRETQHCLRGGETKYFDFHRKKDLPRGVCISCERKRKNSLFAHIGMGHQAFCYECAKRWWRYHKNCPMCNKRILQILQIIRA